MAKQRHKNRSNLRNTGNKPTASANRAGRSNRNGSGAYWIYGLHAVTAALENPEREILRVFATETAIERIPRAANAITVSTADRSEIDRLVGPDAVHQGLAAEVRPLEPYAIEDVIRETESQDRAILIALDQASDPRNVGAILRTAAAFGATALIQQDRHAPPVSGAMAKAASGGLERVHLIDVTNIARALDLLKQAGFWIAGLDSGEGKQLGAESLPERCCLVLGAEGGGLRRLTREHCDLIFRIPISNSIESLNISNAAAIALYEFRRTGIRAE